MARGIGGLFSQSCSRARRGSFFQCNFFRFDFGSIFGSIKASIKKGIEKGFEEESKLENRNRPNIKTAIEKGSEKGIEEDSKLEISSLLGSDWGDGARGQYIYMYIRIHIGIHNVIVI